MTTTHTDLADRATEVLRDNDTGRLVTAAPNLYPHMWSWDAAIVAIGLAHTDTARAVAELDTLLDAQWADGMIPHTVFTDSPGYFPGPDRWRAHTSDHHPAHVQTSGICQPPVHAIALRRILHIARQRGGTHAATVEAFARDVWHKLYRWHEWIRRYRIPDHTGLVAIVHGWESGMDNSPRWDAPYARVSPGPDMAPYARCDLHSPDSLFQRPADVEYDRYLWLVEQMARVNYRPRDVVAASDFLVGDVFTTALFSVASQELADLADDLELPVGVRGMRLRKWGIAARRAVNVTCRFTGTAADYDMRTAQYMPTDTVAAFAPLVCGGLPVLAEQDLLAQLTGPRWCGHPGLSSPLPPTVSPSDPDFDARKYWRGPQWPVVTWLLWWALRRRRRGFGLTEGWRRAALSLLDGDGTFAEYYDPLTGSPLGSERQSWTAAVTLDWIHGEAL